MQYETDLSLQAGGKKVKNRYRKSTVQIPLYDTQENEGEEKGPEKQSLMRKNLTIADTQFKLQTSGGGQVSE